MLAVQEQEGDAATLRPLPVCYKPARLTITMVMVNRGILYVYSLLDTIGANNLKPSNGSSSAMSSSLCTPSRSAIHLLSERKRMQVIDSFPRRGHRPFAEIDRHAIDAAGVGSSRAAGN